MSDMTYEEAWGQLKKKINTLAKSMDNVENIGVKMTCAEPKTIVYQLLNTMLRLDDQVAFAEKKMTTVGQDDGQKAQD